MANSKKADSYWLSLVLSFIVFYSLLNSPLFSFLLLLLLFSLTLYFCFQLRCLAFRRSNTHGQWAKLNLNRIKFKSRPIYRPPCLHCECSRCYYRTSQLCLTMNIWVMHRDVWHFTFSYMWITRAQCIGRWIATSIALRPDSLFKLSPNCPLVAGFFHFYALTHSL